MNSENWFIGELDDAKGIFEFKGYKFNVFRVEPVDRNTALATLKRLLPHQLFSRMENGKVEEVIF